jgi:hypothetical protein
VNPSVAMIGGAGSSPLASARMTSMPAEVRAAVALTPGSPQL